MASVMKLRRKTFNESTILLKSFTAVPQNNLPSDSTAVKKQSAYTVTGFSRWVKKKLYHFAAFCIPGEHCRTTQNAAPSE